MSKINFKSAKFLVSASKLKECPPEQGAEVAIAGRSNAGKSSAINALTQNNKLARISKTPGCTQLINFFQLNNSPNLRLVDLPGYGYSKVSKSMQQDWQAHLSQYLSDRQSLKGVVLIMDIRHPMQDSDEMVINWAVQSEMPLLALLSKCDKLSRGAAQNTVLKYRKEFEKAGLANLVSVQMFSSVSREGVDQLAQQVGIWLDSE